MGNNKLKKKRKKFFKKLDPIIEHETLPIVYNTLSRRLFIKGSSSYLAIPFIASLLPKEVWAQAANEAAYRKAVFMVNRHGGHWVDSHPRGINYNQTNGVKHGRLDSGSLGPIYSNRYNNLKNKMSVLMGLDAVGCWGHQAMATPLAGSFSNKRTVNGKSDVYENTSFNPDSIDVAISKKIYGSSHPLKVLRFGSGTTHCYSNGRTVSGISINAAYDLIMNNLVQDPSNNPPSSSGPTEQELANQQRKYILERALASISETRQSSKISAAAKSHISTHQEILAQFRDAIPELNSSNQNNNNTPQAANSCGNLQRPNPSGTQGQLRAQADMIVAALSCGVTRLSYMKLPEEHFYVHRVNNKANRANHVNYLKNTALDVGGYLMGLMDQIDEGNGNSLLENSCVLITSDLASSKFLNHTGLDMRVLVGGGLNGKLRMGQSIDFKGSRKIVSKSSSGQISQGDGLEKDIYGGRIYNELLITILKSFGLNQSDYGRSGKSGYGDYDINEIPHAQIIRDKIFSNHQTQVDVMNYVRNYVIKNYNRDSTLPYYYLG